MMALGAGFWGAADSETLRIRAFEGSPVSEAVIPGVGPATLEHEIILEDFLLERYESGVPSMFEAKLKIEGEDVSLKVNHPYSLSYGEDLYLVGYDTAAGEQSEWCIMQIVREPWRYWAFAGIVMMLAGALLMFLQGPKLRRGEVTD
jgi:cytochrome c biogenesis protein ResB